ncbi:MAG: crotonase/enoyl-CoA hydratase family protein [Paracoccaceae bacterium]
MPKEIENAIQLADSDPDIHVIILSDAGKAFCAGYDLEHYSTESETNNVIQGMPWDPMKDYQFMWRNTQHFMSLWRAMKPVICKIHGYALAGGSDIALCADMTVMADDAEIGYMPARVWGTPTTAMWVQRLGPEHAKRMLFTGDRIKGKEAAEIGLVLKSVPLKKLDEYVENLAARMASVPVNQLAMQKMIINQAMESSGLMEMQRMSTLFDGISRHSPEGLEFKRRVDEVGWKKAVDERDEGTYDWTRKKKI